MEGVDDNTFTVIVFATKSTAIISKNVSYAGSGVPAFTPVPLDLGYDF